jgi:hypothetical protein
MLGVQDDIVPEWLAPRLEWDASYYGDFYVCPFTKENSYEMQLVCVESADKLVKKE